MTSRRNLKDRHESSVLLSYENYLKKQNIDLVVKERPDPPDAIVTIDGNDTWIEITDAFFNQETAISITSHAADDVVHRPSKGGVVIDPDSISNKSVEAVIRKKLKKTL